jgi:hypothetical protein
METNGEGFMAHHIRANKVVRYLVPLLKLISDNNIPCIERLWICNGNCFDPLNPDKMMTKHYTWEFPSGTELFVCTKCGAQIIFEDSNDRAIDLLEPELQKKAREDYKEYNKMITGKAKAAVKNHRSGNR